MRFQRVLKLKHLLLIRTLGAELNMRRCAELLHTSQPALSRMLSEIEELLGHKLFERNTRRVVPTPLGLNMVWHAQRVLGDLDQAEADFNALVRGASQVLHVGVLAGFPPMLLGRAVAGFVAKWPDIELRLHEGLAAELFLSLKQDRVNLILSHIDVQRDDFDVVAEIIYEERAVVIAGTSHALVRRRRLSMEELAGQRWILPPAGTTIRVAIERELLLSAGTRRLPPIVESTGPQFTAALLQSSDMVAAVPEGVGHWLEQSCGVAKPLRLRASLPSWPVCVARHGARPASPAEKDFVACLAECATPPVQRTSNSRH